MEGNIFKQNTRKNLTLKVAYTKIEQTFIHCLYPLFIYEEKNEMWIGDIPSAIHNA